MKVRVIIGKTAILWFWPTQAKEKVIFPKKKISYILLKTKKYQIFLNVRIRANLVNSPNPLKIKETSRTCSQKTNFVKEINFVYLKPPRHFSLLLKELILIITGRKWKLLILVQKLKRFISDLFLTRQISVSFYFSALIFIFRYIFISLALILPI